MFLALPENLKQILLTLTSKYKNDDMILDTDVNAESIEMLRSAGYLKLFTSFIDGSYNVQFDYEDLNYLHLEVEYNRQYSSQNSIIINNNGQLNHAESNSIINATQSCRRSSTKKQSIFQKIAAFVDKFKRVVGKI